MKRYTQSRNGPACWTAVLLAAVISTTTVHAAAPALQAQVTLRPLTPSEINDYALTNVPNIQGASGLSTVGVGQPAYLEVLVNYAVTNADITNVTWSLTSQPVGSTAALTESPLGPDVPTYKMADRFDNTGAPKAFKVVGRKLLLPDMEGPYTVAVSVKTSSSGSSNLTQNIMAAKYMGINTCKLCHSGGAGGAPDKYGEWLQTGHASFFTKAIDGLESNHYNQKCIVCHTVGYDANTNAVNNGFDDVATQVGWTFPTNLVVGNWAALTNKLKNLSNIQCENCHGPGSQHAEAETRDPFSPEARAAIAVTWSAGDCAQCHDSKPNHTISAQWNNSKHAIATRTPTGAGREACARCHTDPGLAAYTENLGTTNTWTGTNKAYTAYTAITCQGCHDPHNADNPHQLRAEGTVTLGNGTTVTNAGFGALCMNCHQSRTGSYTNSLVNYPVGKPTYAGGSSSFGPHDNPAADMIEGVNGYTYGQIIPSAAHANSVTNTCVGCHMQSGASGFTEAGGHSMKMSYDTIAGGVTNTVDMVGVCVKCHGAIESFNMVKSDYNGDGLIEGVQTEVQKLLNKLSTLMPNSTYQANPANYVADGLVKSPSVKTNWPAKFLQSAWNWQFVNNDLSKGVHNAPYAVGLLKASIGNLNGDDNNDGLADEWQSQYFGAGFATNALAGPLGVNNTNGIPNWMIYAMGLAPTSGSKVGNGVIYVNNGNVVNGDTNTIAIYTAAEIAFDTVPGTTYQIQGITAFTASWQNIGAPIVGTGSTVSYVTPTQGTQQMYFRVAHNP